VDQVVLFKREELAMFTATVMDCPFCSPALRAAEVMLENEYCLFIQQAEAVLIGSGLIIPKAHRESLFDLTPAEWAATFTLLQQVKALLDAQYQPDGYNVGWNCGKVGGQTIFHAHLHVIPRYADEPLAGKGIRYWIKQEVNKRGSRVDG
jgi:diadenosine tetraphosphate (Ap4A) HIT family hydrolase